MLPFELGTVNKYWTRVQYLLYLSCDFFFFLPFTHFLHKSVVTVVKKKKNRDLCSYFPLFRSSLSKSRFFLIVFFLFLRVTFFLGPLSFINIHSKNVQKDIVYGANNCFSISALPARVLPKSAQLSFNSPLIPCVQT